MTNKAFQQYMDMFYRENPTESKAYHQIMNDFYSENGEVLPILHADSICDKSCSLGVFMHPYIIDDHCKLHVHDCFELIYLSRGRCIQTIGADVCNMTEGDICILDPNITHRVDLESETDQLFHIMIKSALFQNAFLNIVSRNDIISNFFINSLFANDRRQSYLYFPHEGNTSACPVAQHLIIELYEKSTVTRGLSRATWISFLLSLSAAGDVLSRKAPGLQAAPFPECSTTSTATCWMSA